MMKGLLTLITTLVISIGYSQPYTGYYDSSSREVKELSKTNKFQITSFKDISIAKVAKMNEKDRFKNKINDKTFSDKTVTNNASWASQCLTVGKLKATSGMDNGAPDAAVLVSRVLNTNSSGGHGFRDGTVFARDNNGGYNSFDADADITGVNTNHALGFQSRMTLSGKGVVSDFYGLGVLNKIYSPQHVLRNYGVDVWEYSGSGSTNYNYGVHIHELTKGDKNNLAIRTDGATKSSLEGGLGVGYLMSEKFKPNSFWGANSKGIHIKGSHVNGSHPYIEWEYNHYGIPILYSIGVDQENVVFYTSGVNKTWEFRNSARALVGIRDDGLIVRANNLNRDDYGVREVKLSTEDTTSLNFTRDGYTLKIKPHTLTNNHTLRLPTKSGVIATLSDISDANKINAKRINVSDLHVTNTEGYNQLRLEKPYTPTSTSDSNGDTGDIAWDNDYLYIKTPAGWKRTSLSTF